MTTKTGQAPHRQRRPRDGFTLLELLASLMVLSIAGTIFLNMFISSVRLGNTSRDHRVGLQLAEEYLTELQTRPGQFKWPHYEGNADTFLPVGSRTQDDLVLRAAQPSAMPTTKRAYNKTAALYSDFSWKAFSRLPEKDGNIVEILVDVTWTDDSGRFRTFSLSSLAPREGREGMD